MIEESKYKSLLDSGLSLDHYFLLCNIKNKIKSVDSKRIQGFVNLLTKKGYIKDDELTDKGLILVETCKDQKSNMDFGEWIVLLHKKIQDKLVELTGKKQVLASINKGGKEYYFLEGVRVLNMKLSRVITLYKLKDFQKIENTILRYVEKCHEKNNWFPLLHYWILKDNISQMVTALETDEEEDVKPSTSTQKFV